MRIQAELFNTEIHVLWFDYRVHFTLPWSREQVCGQLCEINRIPPGEGTILVSNPEKSQTFFVSVARDTLGTIDLRSPLTMNFLSETDMAPLRARVLSEEEKNLLGNISSGNRVG